MDRKGRRAVTASSFRKMGRRHGSPPKAGRPSFRARGGRLAFTAVALALAVGALALGLTRGQSRPTRPAAALSAGVEETEARLLQAVTTNPDDAAARLELGKYYEGKKRPFEALWEYAEARHLAPGNAELPARIGAALQDGQIIDRAEAELLAAWKAHPDDLGLGQQLADLYLATARPEEALKLLEARRARLWEDPDDVIALGRARHAAGDVEGAVTAFKRSLELRSGHYEAWYRLGRAYFSAGEWEKARDAFFHAMVAVGNQPEYPFYAGLTYLEQNGPGDLDRAISFFKDALARKADYAPAHYYEGVALEKMGRREEALSKYSFAILADTTYPEPNLALGRGLLATGKKKDGHRYLGRYYDLRDRPEEAAREFKAMAAAAPKSPQPTLLLGQVYIRTQQSEKATAATEAALKTLPADVELLERLTILKINRGDRPTARKLLQKWMQLRPKDSRPYWLMGRCDLGDLKYAEGVAWLEKAVAVQPKNPHYLGFLGAGLLRLGTPGSLERSAETLAQAVALAPDNAEYRDLYGQALRRLGREEEARRQFLQALNVDPFRISCFTPATQIAWRLKRPGPGSFFPSVTRSVQARLSEENILWPRVWQQPRDAEARMKLARFFCRTANLRRARDQLEQLVEQQPRDRQAQALLATVRRCQEVLP